MEKKEEGKEGEEREKRETRGKGQGKKPKKKPQSTPEEIHLLQENIILSAKLRLMKSGKLWFSVGSSKSQNEIIEDEIVNG